MKAGDQGRFRKRLPTARALAEEDRRIDLGVKRVLGRGRTTAPARAAGQDGARLRVTVSDEWGGSVAAAADLDRWLARVAPARTAGTVNVALVSDGRVRALNRRYRGRDYATDVLSFPARGPARTDASSSTHDPSSQLSSRCLGEIVIARGVAQRQARSAGHSHGTELRVLALHGLLHLLGYDHERDAGAMARVEHRLRVKGGLQASLLERHARGAAGPYAGKT